jgi:lipopolysaccharide transport system permease protein
MLADTVKFVFIFLLLVVILWCIGYRPNIAYLALPIVFVAVFLVAAGAGFVVASVVPLLPDLRFVIEQVLFVVMFLSGVVFSLESVPSPIREIMELNPIAVLMEGTRGILMRGEWPNWVGLTKVGVISIAVCLVGIAFVKRLASRYPKLAT